MFSAVPPVGISRRDVQKTGGARGPPGGQKLFSRGPITELSHVSGIPTTSHWGPSGWLWSVELARQGAKNAVDQSGRETPYFVQVGTFLPYTTGR